MNFGWSCPHCGKAHAPHVQTCPEPAQMVPPVIVPTVWPAQPYPSVPSVPGQLHPWTVTCGTMQSNHDPDLRLWNA